MGGNLLQAFQSLHSSQELWHEKHDQDKLKHSTEHENTKKWLEQGLQWNGIHTFWHFPSNVNNQWSLANELGMHSMQGKSFWTNYMVPHQNLSKLTSKVNLYITTTLKSSQVLHTHTCYSLLKLINDILQASSQTTQLNLNPSRHNNMWG